MWYLYVSIGIFIIGLILFIVGIKKEKLTVEEAANKHREYIEELTMSQEAEYRSRCLYRQSLEEDIQRAKNLREMAIERATEAQAATNKVLASEQERLAAELQCRKELEEAKIQQAQEKQIEQLGLLYQRKNEELHAQYVLEQAKYQRDIDQLKAEFDKFAAMQQAVNEAILREKELKESDKSDIHFLLSIEDNINNKELLHKLIWTEYIQRPFNQMINSVFGSKVPKNVIYCIEDINTHKKYIGKTSAEVSKRWTDHIKNSLNIGTIKRQNIHDALYNHWDEFTFTILE